MGFWNHLPYLARRLDRRRAEKDLDDELQAHLDLEIEGNLAAGMSPDEARRAARRKLGNLSIARQDVRAVWELPFVETTWKDLRHAARLLRARRGYAFAAIVSLALGIGVCTAVWTVVDRVLLRPLPYPDADRIVELREVSRAGRRMRVAEPNALDVRRESGSFDALAQYASDTMTVTGGEQPARAGVVVAGRDFFRVFQTEPALGRGFTPEECAQGGPPVAVVGHAFWRRVLGERADLGRLRIDGETYVVVGVMPAGFDFPREADVWINRERLSTPDASRTAHNWNVVGRVRVDVGMEQARADVSAVARRLARENGEQTDAADMALVPLHDYIVGDTGRALWILFGAVGLLLLIALANVANLMLAQAASRSKELALRAALGATRPRLVRQFVSEAVLLALLGAAAGVPLAVIGVDLLLGLDGVRLPRAGAISVDLRALLFTFGLSLAVAVVLGAVTALRGTGVDLRAAVVEGGRNLTAGAARSRLRRALVVVQVALAFTLLIGAGLLARSFAGLVAVDPGFRPSGAMVVDLALPVSRNGWSAGAPDSAHEERLRGFGVQLIERLSALPGVTAIGAINALPIRGGANGTFLIDGDPARPANAEYRVASAGYFATMGIPLLRGRLLGPRDVRGAPHAAVISQSLARRVWPDGDAIGKRIQFGNMDGDPHLLHIVGIVGDVREDGLHADVAPTVYAHALQRPPSPALSIVVRGPGAVESALRAELARLDPDLPVEIDPLDRLVASSLDGRRFTLILLSVFASVALLLALTGIYGVTAYSVAQRTNEIGVRMALGARPRAILAMVIREGVVLALAGVMLGALAAAALTRVIASWLHGVSAADPVTFAAAALVLAGAAVLACWVPARRAVNVDPMAALRSD